MQGDSQLVRSSQGEASYSGTARHLALTAPDELSVALRGRLRRCCVNV